MRSVIDIGDLYPVLNEMHSTGRLLKHRISLCKQNINMQGHKKAVEGFI